jgi:hypothetical protein
MSETDEATLSVADIRILKQVIEVVSKRGAINADELSTIGPVYDRVSAWLHVVDPPQEQEDEQTNSEGETDA